MLGCGDDVAPSDTIGIRTEEAYTTITKAEWTYPAILAAYDAVACSPAATAHPGSRLSCREVYVAEPDDIADDDLVCDIAFPSDDRPPLDALQRPSTVDVAIGCKPGVLRRSIASTPLRRHPGNGGAAPALARATVRFSTERVT